MSSYSKNIARLKSTSRANLQFSSQDRLNAARTAGLAQEREAEKIAKSLSEFSGHLKQYSKDLIDKRTEEGILEARRVATENAKERTILEKEAAQIEEAKKLGIVLEGFEDAKRMEAGFQKIKAEKLRLEGESVYPEADRLAKLSPWQQVGYAKEKLRMFNESFPDKLAHEMANSTEKININGVLISPAEMRDSNIQGLPFKEVASRIFADKIRKAAGIDRFSPELLKIAGTEKAVQDAIDTQLDEARNRYNIDASTKTRGQADLDFQTGAKTGEDIARYHMTIANTIGKDGKLIGNVRAWDHVFAAMAKEGAEDGGNTKIADEYGKKELPEDLRKALGKPPGTTFEEAWPGRFKKLRADILAGNAAIQKAQLEATDARKNEITNKFQAAAKAAYQSGRTLTATEIAQWKSQYAVIGENPPKEVTDYETASARNVADDIKQIDVHIATSGYGITNDELDHFHPLAAAKYRKKADTFEKARYEKYGADEIIKGALDTNFDDMGYKDKEKSDVYQIAKANAERDYHQQLNEYIGMGIPEETAHWWALKGPPADLTNDEGKPLFGGRLGVIQEIRENGSESKYVKEGLFIEKTVGNDLKRARHIMSGKKEMGETPNIRRTGIIGGDYGQKQLDAIKKNIEKYGLYRGVAMSEEHVQYYKGLMQGRSLQEGGWWALLNDQLKVDGEMNLDNNTAVDSVLPLLTKKVPTADGEDEDLDDPDGVTEVSDAGINAADNGAPFLAYNYITDADNYYNNLSNGSIFDQPDQIPTYLGGTA